MKSESRSGGTAQDVTLWQMISALRSRWRLVAGITLLSTSLAVAASFLMTPVYRAEVLLMPVNDDSMAGALNGEVGLLGNLAGLTKEAQVKDEAIATLESRLLTEAFIRENNLLPVLFADLWKAETKTWDVDDPADIPTLWDANDIFERRVRIVADNKRTGLVTLSIEWEDPRVAAEWANELVQRTNAQLRERALARTSRNIDYLEKELARTSPIELQQAISRLLEHQLKQVMLAKGNAEFAFKVIDPAVPPEQRARPKRKLIAVAGFILGTGLSCLIVWALESWRLRRESGSP